MNITKINNKMFLQGNAGNIDYILAGLLSCKMWPIGGGIHTEQITKFANLYWKKLVR